MHHREVEVLWDHSEHKVLLKYPHGLDKSTKTPLYELSYLKPEEAFGVVKSLNGNNPAPDVYLSGGSNLKDKEFLEFLERFGSQVRSFTYVSTQKFPLNLTDFVSVLTNFMANLEEIDFRQLRFLKMDFGSQEEFLEGVESGKKLERVTRIILGDQSELTAFFLELIFRLTPNLEQILDFPLHLLTTGILGKERRKLVESVSFIPEREDVGISLEEGLKDLEYLAESSPKLRKKKKISQISEDGIGNSLEDFNVNLFLGVSMCEGIYKMFDI